MHNNVRAVLQPERQQDRRATAELLGRALGRTLDFFRKAPQAGDGLCVSCVPNSGSHDRQTAGPGERGLHRYWPAWYGRQRCGPVFGTGTALRAGTGSGGSLRIALLCQPAGRVVRDRRRRHACMRGGTVVVSRCAGEVIATGGLRRSTTGHQARHTRGAADQPYHDWRAGRVWNGMVAGGSMHGGSRRNGSGPLILDSARKDQPGGGSRPCLKEVLLLCVILLGRINPGSGGGWSVDQGDFALSVDAKQTAGVRVGHVQHVFAGGQAHGPHKGLAGFP